MSDGLVAEVGLILILIVLLIILLPLLCGIGIATLCGLTGLMYYIGILATACVIWFILCLIWWW